MIVWQAHGFSKARHRRDVAAHRATFRRVETRIAPEHFARLQALCERPEGEARPSRGSVLSYVISLGLTRAEKINASTERRCARIEERQRRGDPAGIGGARGSLY